jgi:alkaline phosphatase D
MSTVIDVSSRNQSKGSDVRVIQISDTHLSVEHRHFERNTNIIADSLATRMPDLIVHTGDISMDGAGGRRQDLELAKRWNSRLPAEVLSLPGNHDVGDLASNRPDQPVTEANLTTWRDIIGPDRWHRALGNWQLIGLNAMLLGTGLDDEEEQFDWLASIASPDRPIALFIHKPLCIDATSEGPRGYWTITPEPRARLLGVLAGKQVRLVASGHLHIQRQKTMDGIDHVWAPASSFVVGASQENLGGERCLGFVEHEFGTDAVSSRFVRPRGLEELLLDPVRSEIYSG